MNLSVFRRAWLRLGWAVVLGSFAAAVCAGEPMRFVHPPPEQTSDARHLYYWQVLEAALKATEADWGPYTVSAYPVAMNFSRAAYELERAKGRVNIVARATNLDLEKRLRPVPIPLDKGLLGFRLFLILAGTQAQLAEVETLDELGRLRIGQSSVWTDSAVLAANGLRLELSENYEGLFVQLGLHRFELLARGINEIDAEWRAHRDQVPGLTIDRYLLLHYPMPRYFFVPRTREGARMAQRITEGLQRLRKTGEFERRYQAYKRSILADIPLAGRRVFELHNPELSDLAPLQDPYWWETLQSELAPARRQMKPR